MSWLSTRTRAAAELFNPALFHPAFLDRACVIDRKGMTTAMPIRALPDGDAEPAPPAPASQGPRRRRSCTRAVSVAAMVVAATLVPKKPADVLRTGVANDPFPFIMYHPGLRRRNPGSGSPVPRQLLTSPGLHAAASSPTAEASRPLAPPPRAAANTPSAASPSPRVRRAELTPQNGGARGFPAFRWRIQGAAGKPVMPVFPKRKAGACQSKMGHKKRRLPTSSPSRMSALC